MNTHYGSHTLLHLLRNPYGHSDDTVREARIKAAELIEKLLYLSEGLTEIETTLHNHPIEYHDWVITEGTRPYSNILFHHSEYHGSEDERAGTATNIVDALTQIKAIEDELTVE